MGNETFYGDGLTTILRVASGKCESLRDDETSVFLSKPETF